MLFLYQTIASFIVLISPIIIIYRISKKKEDKIRFKEKFSLSSKSRANGKLIWFHGASVGEILSVVPLIKYYEKNKNIKQILITSSTLSSSNVIKKFKFKKTAHQFYPIDFMPFVNSFLSYWKPCVGIFIDSEIWPCMFKSMSKKNIPILLINARLTKKTFNRWFAIRSFSQKIFNNIKVAYPQNNETNFFLKKLKPRTIKMIGNLKFAENFDTKLNSINNKLNLEFKKKTIWVASSTHKNEEIFCANSHLELKKKYKNLLTIIVPRHVHRANEIKTELEKLKINVKLHSSKPTSLKDTDIYLVDTFGETKKFHKMAASVFLGGSIVNKGGQNPLEASRLGAKIFHGPDTSNFKDVYKLLNLLGISKKIKTPKELASNIVFKKNKKTGLKIKNIGEKILKKNYKRARQTYF